MDSFLDTAGSWTVVRGGQISRRFYSIFVLCIDYIEDLLTYRGMEVRWCGQLRR